MKFVPAPSSSYCEIMQDSDIKYAWAKPIPGGVQQTHDFIKCRDFFNESLVACQIGCPSPAIYGFTYDVNKHRLPMDKVRLILKGVKIEELVSNLKTLNECEERVGFTPTEMTPIPETDYFLLTGDEKWIRSTVMISFYTHILRCLYQYDVEEGESLELFLTRVGQVGSGNAAKYQKAINNIPFLLLLERVDEVFPVGTLPKEGMKKIDNISKIHNYSGIVTWSKAVSSRDGKGLLDQYVDQFEVFVKMVGKAA